MSGSFVFHTSIDAKLSDNMSAHHSRKFPFQILIMKPIGVYIQIFKRKLLAVMGCGQHAKSEIHVQTLSK